MDQAKKSNVIFVDGFIHQVNELHTVLRTVEILNTVRNDIQHNEDMTVVFFADVFQVFRQRFKTLIPGNLQQGDKIKVVRLVCNSIAGL